MPGPSPPLTILHRDERVLVVAKPAGLLSVPTPGAAGSTVPGLLRREGVEALPVHRLDREVSGALLLALDEDARARLEDAFRGRNVSKTYWALAQGRVKPAQGQWRFPILERGAFARVSAHGKAAETRYRTLESLPVASVVEIDLVTGRYNQARLHFAHAGFPLVGERKYARGKEATMRAPSRRVALHAWRIAFPHPGNGRRIEVEAPLPDDLLRLLERARDGRRKG